MSYTTINQSTNDPELRARINAAVAKESWANEEFGSTPDGQLVQQSGPDSVVSALMWPCCIDFETDYAYAVDAGNEHPGGDPGVITDAAIQSAVQTHWRTPPVEEEPVIEPLEPEPEPEPTTDTGEPSLPEEPPA